MFEPPIAPGETRLLTLLRRRRAVTAAEAARALGVSVPTVTVSLRTLREAGIVSEAGLAGSSGGRKPLRYRFESSGVLAIGVALHPGVVEVVTADLDLAVVSSRSIAYRGRTPGTMAAAIRLAVQSQTGATAVAGDRPRPFAVGVSLPGIVDVGRCRLTLAPNLFVDDMALEIPDPELPTVFENEANAAALAETYLENSDGPTSLAFVSVSHGLGVGIVFNGRLYAGSGYRAGEFGHVPIPGGSRRCNCGSVGCWEQYASQSALLRGYCEKTGTVKESGTGEYTASSDGVRGNRDAPGSELADYLAALTAGEPPAVECFESYLDSFSLGLQNVIRCLDPGRIVIGGGVTGAGDLLINGLNRRLARVPMGSPPPVIALSRLGNRAAALGGAALQLRRYFNPV